MDKVEPTGGGVARSHHGYKLEKDIILNQYMINPEIVFDESKFDDEQTALKNMLKAQKDTLYQIKR